MDVSENMSTTNANIATEAAANSSNNTSNTRDSPLQSVSSSGAQSVVSAKHSDENGDIIINASPNEPNGNGDCDVQGDKLENENSQKEMKDVFLIGGTDVKTTTTAEITFSHSEEKRDDTMHHNTSTSTTSNLNKRSIVTSARRREGFGFSGPAEVTFLATPPPAPAQSSVGDAVVAGSASPAVAVPLVPMPLPPIDEAGAAYYRDVGSSSSDGGSSIDDIVEEVVQKHFAATGGGWNLNASQHGGNNDASPSPLRCGDSMRVSPSRRQASSFVRRHSDARAGSVLALERSHHRQYQQHFGKPTANNSNPAGTGAWPRSYYRNSLVGAAGSLSRRAYNTLAAANGESDGGGFVSGGGALNSSFHYADGEDDVSASDTVRGNGWSGAELNENTATSMDLLETMERDRMETTRQQATQAAMQAKMATELKRQLQRHAKGRAELQKLQIDRDRLLRELATLNALIQSRQSPLHVTGGLVRRPIVKGEGEATGVKDGANKSTSAGGESSDLQESGVGIKSPTVASIGANSGPSSQSHQNLMMLSAYREDEHQQHQNQHGPSVSLDRIREAEELLAAAMNADVPLGEYYTAEREGEDGPSPLSIDGRAKNNNKSRSAQMRTSRRELRLSVSRRSSLALSPFTKNLVVGDEQQQQQDFYLSHHHHHPHQRLSLSRREIDALIVSSCGSPAVVDLQSNDQDRDPESGHFFPAGEEESPDVQVISNRRVRHTTYAYARNSLSLQPTEDNNNFAPRAIGSTSLELNHWQRQRRRPQNGGVVSNRRPLGGDECAVEESEYRGVEDSARRRTYAAGTASGGGTQSTAVCASTNASPEVNRVVSHHGEEGGSGDAGHQYPSVSLASVAGANELYCDHHDHSSPSPPNASPPNRRTVSVGNTNAVAALAALEEDFKRREAILKAAEEQLELRTAQLAEVQRRLEEREREVVIATPAEAAAGVKPPSSSSSGARRESAFVSLLVSEESRRQRATIEALSKAIKKRHQHEQTQVSELPEEEEKPSSSSPSDELKNVVEDERRLLEEAEAVLSAVPAIEVDAPKASTTRTTAVEASQHDQSSVPVNVDNHDEDSSLIAPPAAVSGVSTETTNKKDKETTPQRSPHGENKEQSLQRKHAEEVEEDDGSPNIRRPIFVIGGGEENPDEVEEQQQQHQQEGETTTTTTQTFKNKEQIITQREDYGKRDKSVSVLRATLSSSSSGGHAAGAEGNTSVAGEENTNDLVEVGRGTVRSTWTSKKQKSKPVADDEEATRIEDPKKTEEEGNNEDDDASLSPTQPPSTVTVFDDVAIHPPHHHQQDDEGEHRDSGSNPYAAYKEVRVLEGHRINRFGGGGSKNSLNLASSLNSSPHHPSAVKKPLVEAEMDSDFLSPTQVIETALAGPVELLFDEKNEENFDSIEIHEEGGLVATQNDAGVALTEEKDHQSFEGGALSRNTFMRSPHAHGTDLLKMSQSNTASLTAEEITNIECLEEAPAMVAETLLEYPAMTETLELPTDAESVVINTAQLVGTRTKGFLSSASPNNFDNVDPSPLPVKASESGMRTESPRGVVETEGKRLLDDEEAELEAFYRYLEAEADETEDGSASPYVQTLGGEIMMASSASSPPPLAPTAPALLGVSSPPMSGSHDDPSRTNTTSTNALGPRSWAGATAIVTTCEMETQTDELHTEVKEVENEKEECEKNAESESATVIRRNAGTSTDENVVVTTREELEAMEEAYARELEAIADDLDAAALATNSTQTIECLPPVSVTAEFEVEVAPADGDNELCTAGPNNEEDASTNTIVSDDVHDNASPQVLPPPPLSGATVVIDFALSASDGSAASTARTSSNQRQSPRKEEEIDQHGEREEECQHEDVNATVLPLKKEEEKNVGSAKPTALNTESSARSVEADEDEIRKRLILELVAAGVIPPDFENQSNNDNNTIKKHRDSRATRRGVAAVENSPFGDNDPANEGNPYYSSAESSSFSRRSPPTADPLHVPGANNTNARIFASLVAARDERRRKHHSTIKRSVFSRTRLTAAAAAPTSGARKKNIAKAKQKPTTSNRGESHSRDEADDPYTSDYSTATEEADDGHSGDPLEKDVQTLDVEKSVPLPSSTDLAQSNDDMEGRAFVVVPPSAGAGTGMGADSLSRSGEQQENDSGNSKTIVVAIPVAADILAFTASPSSVAAFASVATSSPTGENASQTAESKFGKEKEKEHSVVNVDSSEDEDPTDAMDYADWKKAIASAVAYRSSSSVAVAAHHGIRHKEHNNNNNKHFVEGVKTAEKGKINKKERDEEEEARLPIPTGISESLIATSPREKKDQTAGGEPQDRGEEVDAVTSPAKSFCSPSPPSEISPSPNSNPITPTPYLLPTEVSAHDHHNHDHYHHHQLVGAVPTNDQPVHESKGDPNHHHLLHPLHKNDDLINTDSAASIQKTEKGIVLVGEASYHHDHQMLHVPVVATDDALNAVSASSVAVSALAACSTPLSCSPPPPPTVEGAEADGEGGAFGTQQRESSSPLGARSETKTPCEKHRLASEAAEENEDEEAAVRDIKQNTIATKACDDKGDQRISSSSSSESAADAADGLDLLFAVDPHTVKLTARDTQCLDRDQLVALLAVVRGQLTSAMAEQAIQKGRAERYADLVTSKSRQIHTLSQVLGDTQRRAADSATIVDSVFSGVLKHAPNRSHTQTAGPNASSLTNNTDEKGNRVDATEEAVVVPATEDTIVVSTSAFFPQTATALVVGSERNLYGGDGAEDEEEDDVDYLSPASAAPPTLHYDATSASYNHSTNNCSAVVDANNREKNTTITTTVDNINNNAPVSLNATASSSSSAIMKMRRMMHTPVTADAITPTVAERRRGKKLQQMRVGVGEGRVAAGVSVSQHRPNEDPAEVVDSTEAEGNHSREVILAVVTAAEEGDGYDHATMTEEDEEEEAGEKQLMRPTDRSVVLRPTSLFVDYAEPQRTDLALTAIIHSARRSVSTGRGRTDGPRTDAEQAEVPQTTPSVASPKPMRPKILQNEEQGEEEASPLPHSPQRAGHPTFAHTTAAHVNGVSNGGNVVRQPSSIALKLIAQRDRRRNQQKESSNDSSALLSPKPTTAKTAAPKARAPPAAPFARAVTLHRPLAGTVRGGGAEFGRTQTQTHSVTTPLSTPTNTNNTSNYGIYDHPPQGGLGFRRQQSAAYQQQQVGGLGQRKGSAAALSTSVNNHNQSLRVPDSVMLFGSVLEEAKARARSPMRQLQTAAGSRNRLAYAGGATMTTTTTSSGLTNGITTTATTTTAIAQGTRLAASRRGAVPPPPQTLANR